MRDGLYHVTSRGNEGRSIFTEREDRLRFLQILGDYYERFGILIHAYVLMDNHYHLVLGTPRGNLLKVMHGINSGYTGYVNRKYKRKGHLFQGRYKGILVEKETYLLPLSRYVHLNPLRASLVKKPENYEWSSYRGYLGKAKTPKWFSPDWVLAPFGGKDGRARSRYRAYVEAGLEMEGSPLAKVVGQVILGGEDFVAMVKERVKRKVWSREIVERKKLQAEIPLEKVGQIVKDAFGVRQDYMLGRGKRENLPRKAALYLAKRLTEKGNREIGEFFGGIQASAVSKAAARLEKEMARDQDLRSRMESLKSYVKA